jgi:hypothetical protein
MHEKDSVEAVLSRLMPPALSEGSQRGIEEMIDGLAGSARASLPVKHLLPASIIGIAACLAAAIVIPILLRPDAQAPSATTAAIPEFLLMGESDRIEAMSDEGWSEIPDGSAMRALRMRVVGESRLFDGETGIVMQVSQPREELLLMPVTAF